MSLPRPLNFSPLLTSINERHGYRVVRASELAEAAAAHEHVVLMLSGDAERLAESNDLAVVLPELIAAFRGRLTAVVAAREDERVFQRTYRFSSFPALVFLRRGQYLGAITRIRDWSDYLREIPEILAREPSEPPPFKLPGEVARAKPDRAGDPELDPDYDHHGHEQP